MAQMRLFVFLGVVTSVLFAHGVTSQDRRHFVTAEAKNKLERDRIAQTGVAIDGVLSDSVTFLANDKELALLKQKEVRFSTVELSKARRDFPTEDASFHNYAEMMADLKQIEKENSGIAKIETIGKSLEGREIKAIRISSHPWKDTLPTIVFMGCHHAREHLSVEVPLKLAQHLTQNYTRDSRVQELIDSREIWIIPMVNPDGAEYDISSGSQYKWWRKNRRKNSNGTYGVDLNRNYGGSAFAGPGSSNDPSSDTYHGPSAFSEPETQVVRDFVRARKKATILLSFHTFSELILWPWGHTDDEIPNAKDREVFEKMGKTMANWNHYTPQKSSELYLASGDTTDWAYEELKLFAFTFELSPDSMFGGGFYPGAEAIEPTFKANLEPALYLIEHAADPYAVLNE